MGLRGIGASKAAAARQALKSARLRRPSWQRPGLSRVQRVVAFVQSLKITSGPFAGQRFRLRKWQREQIIDPIYRTDADGHRIVRSALVTMGRKNGKTGLAAALALCHLVGPEAEQRGQVLSAASDRDQAALLFAEMEAMIQADLRLAARCNIQRFNKRIEDSETGSIYQALSSDARKAHGLSPSFVVNDELAQWHSRDLYDNLVTGTGARAEPLVITISTQSSDPTSIMSELVDYAERVRDGVIVDPTFHAALFIAPPELDPWDEATWRLANPALDDFRSLDEMRTAAKQAQRIPARESVFRSLYLNQRVDAQSHFIASADWEACGGAVDAEALRGKRCYGGLDLSSTTDLTALVLFFPDDGGAVLLWCWLPGDGLAERENRDRVPYRLWRDARLLITTPGRAISKPFVAATLAEIASTFDVQEIGFDRWRIEDLKRILADEGIDLPLIEVGMGFRDQGPCVDALETAVLDAKLAHGGNPLLRWAISNCIVEIDAAGNRKLSKDKAVGRIDPAVALAVAIGLAQRGGGDREIELGENLVMTL